MRFLAGLVVCGVMATAAFASAGGSETRTVAISIQYSQFDRDTIEVSRGETVTFVIRNRDPISHEFIVGDAAVQRRHENGTEAYHDAIPTEVTIPPGETVSTTVSFGSGGLLDLSKPLLFGCHFPRHYNFGMVGRIVVD